MKAILMKIYDPRLGEEIEIKNYSTGQRFSNLADHFLVIYTVEFDWSNCTDLVEKAIASTSRKGFVAVDPWPPHERQIVETISQSFQNVQESRHSLFAEFEIKKGNINKVFELWKNSEMWDSGIWCIGGYVEAITSPRRLSRWNAEQWDFALILAQSKNVGFALELGEMRQATLIARIFVGIDEWLIQLKERQISKLKK